VLGYYNANGGSGAGTVRIKVFETINGPSGPSVAAEYVATLAPGSSSAASSLVAVGTPAATIGPGWIEITFTINPANADNPSGQTVGLAGVQLSWEAQ